MNDPVSLLDKYRPTTLSAVVGQPAAVQQLQTFAAAPFPHALIFHGPTGVGKTCAGRALAYDLGCGTPDQPREFEDMAGIREIPSGKQDGRAVEELLRTLRIKPFYGLGWKVAMINEADLMTDNAEGQWLDGLEHLGPKTVIVFTTNELRALSKRRLIGRCELVEFSGESPEFINGLKGLVRKIWKAETGKRLARVPEGLGRYELAAPAFSIRLALQQIAPMIRARAEAPEKVVVPFIRTEADVQQEKWSQAGIKAAETKKRNLLAKERDVA